MKGTYTDKTRNSCDTSVLPISTSPVPQRDPQYIPSDRTGLDCVHYYHANHAVGARKASTSASMAIN